MPCYSPIKAYRDQRAQHGDSYPLHFHSANQAGEEIKIGCGRCIGCRLEHSRQWALRCVHEAQLHNNNSYITLTYDNDNLPENGNLNHRDFQLFLKRYRKFLAPHKIKYFMCGEYGEACKLCSKSLKQCRCKKSLPTLGRPHYHAIIFGDQFSDLIFEDSRNGFPYFKSKTLENLWTHGNCIVGEATFESAAYVARYVTKKITITEGLSDGYFDHYLNFDPISGRCNTRPPEYITMSRRPGIGSDWYRKYKGDIEKQYITARGFKMRPPKYYDRLYRNDDRYGFADRQKLNQDKLRQEETETQERLDVMRHLKVKQFKKLPRAEI